MDCRKPHMRPGWVHRAVLAVMSENEPLTLSQIVNKINERSDELLPEGATMGSGAVGAALKFLFDAGKVARTIGEPVARWHL